jgi:hypothetical protein
MGYLLALALQNFSMCDIFTSLRTPLPSTANIDSAIGQQEHRFGKIRAPQAVLIMLNLTTEVPRDDSKIHYAILKVTERLAAANHRNQALLNGIGIVRHVFDKLYTAQSPPLGRRGTCCFTEAVEAHARNGCLNSRCAAYISANV